MECVAISDKSVIADTPVTFADLPIDCITLIARLSIDVYRTVVFTHRTFGLWTIGQHTIDWFCEYDYDGYTRLEGVYHSFNDEPAQIRLHWNNEEWYVWYKRGVKHRDGGPAVERSDYRKWYQNGKKHRDGGLPAVVIDDRYEWWVDGLRHRDDDMPAYINSTSMEYWRHGRFISSKRRTNDDLIEDIVAKMRNS